MITNFKDWLKIQETTTTSNVVSGTSGTFSGSRQIAPFQMPVGGGLLKKNNANKNPYRKCGLAGCPQKSN
jgi:hypothetical protein